MKALIRYVVERNDQIVIQRKTCGRVWSVMSAWSLLVGGPLYLAHIFAGPKDWKLVDNELYTVLNKQCKLARDLKAAIAKENEVRDKLKRLKGTILENGDRRKAWSYYEPHKLKLSELIFKQEIFKSKPKETWREILTDSFDNAHSKAESHIARARRSIGSKDPGKDRLGKTVAFGGKELEDASLNLTEGDIDSFEVLDMNKQNGNKKGHNKNRHKGENEENYAARMANLKA